MATPAITDFILYTGTALTDTDWATNWGEVVKYVGDGTFDFTINTLTTTAGATFGSNVAVTGSVTATTLVGDGAGITNISNAYLWGLIGG